MAPGKKSKGVGKPRAPAAKSSKAKGKGRATVEKRAAKRKIPAAVQRFAKKRNFEIAEEESDHDGTNKPPKRLKKKNRTGAVTYDELVPFELPPPRDFGATFAAKSTAHYTWGAPLTSVPPPQLKKTEGKGKGKQVASFSHCIAHIDLTGDASSRTATPKSMDSGNLNNSINTPQMNKKKQEGSSFLRLPIEIRQNIYSHILVAENPIRVRQGWSAVYPRNRPCLDTSILRVSKLIRREATDILYGENTFLYLLRETVSPPADEIGQSEIVVQHPLAVVEEPLSEYDGNSDAEYNCDEFPVASSTRKSDVEIDIPRVGHKFRHLKIVAEPNRTENGYLLSMANAIAVFRDLKPIRPRIHTITIDITPTRDLDTGDITFANFFEKTSAVMKALRGLPCQYIEVVVNAGDEKETFKVNMKHAASLRRNRRGEKDIWQGDILVQALRDTQAGEAQGQLERLPDNVRKFGEKHNAWNREFYDEEEENDELLWGQDFD